MARNEREGWKRNGAGKGGWLGRRKGESERSADGVPNLANDVGKLRSSCAWGWERAYMLDSQPPTAPCPIGSWQRADLGRLEVSCFAHFRDTFRGHVHCLHSLPPCLRQLCRCDVRAWVCRAELAVIEQRQLRAIEEARVAAGDYVAESRRELEQRLMAMEERAAAAEERVRAAETAARSARAEEERALGDRDGLMLKVGTLSWAVLLREPQQMWKMAQSGALSFRLGGRGKSCKHQLLLLSRR